MARGGSFDATEPPNAQIQALSEQWHAMNEPNASASRASSRQRVSWGPRFLVIGLVLFAVAIVGFYVTLFFGVVVGQEFSPHLLKRREFRYYEIPAIRLKVTPISRSDETSQLLRYLVGEGILRAKTQSDEARWDLVRAHRGVLQERANLIAHGDALILCRYFDAEDSEGEKIWLQWSKKHKPLAKILWPVIAKLAREELYIFIPEVLAIVQDAVDSEELRIRINKLLLRKYVELADSQQELGRHEQAVELYSEALKYDPGSAAAKAGRAKSAALLRAVANPSDPGA
jgi:tetratricopeptide (TPR) repeat protein